MLSSPLILFFLLGTLCTSQNAVAQLEEGDSCTTSDGLDGQCKFPMDCPSSLDSTHRLNSMKRCGFVGLRATICCPIGVSREFDNTKVLPSSHPTQKTIITKKGQLSRKKCKEYTWYAYPDIDIVEGGTLVSIEQFPHMVQIGYGPKDNIAWACGGSIISEYFILTAAHCLRNSEFGNATTLRVGIINHDVTTKQQTRNIADRIPHPEYTTKYHDIGLIKMEKKLNFNQFVRPACLFVENNYPYKEAIVTGWGKTENETSSKHLLKATLEIYSVDRCNETYQSNMKTSLRLGIVDEHMVCAGSPKEIKDTCEGDSGGPMQYMVYGNVEIIFMYHIVGITSFGKSCGTALNVPGVYTRVSGYVDWIEDTVWPSEKKQMNN